MSEYQKFLAEQSSKFLAEILNGVAASGQKIDIKDCTAAAIASAKELYAQLDREGAV